MQVTRAQLKSYDDLLGRLEGITKRSVESGLLAWLSENPDVEVAEAREYAIQLVTEAVGITGNSASELAANMFEVTTGLGATTIESDVSDYVEKEAHYQAGKLVNGDVAGFSRMMGKFAGDQIHRTANRTTMESARAHGKNVRFARVPLGIETCEFCNMLASRGFVYWSRDTAGEFSKYHPRCRCKVICGQKDDFTIDGYDPAQFESLNRAYEEIDADDTLTYAMKQQAKEAITEYNALEHYANYQDLGGKERWYEPIAKAGANQKGRWQAGQLRSSQAKAQGRGYHGKSPLIRAKSPSSGKSKLIAELDSQESVWAYTARCAACNSDREYLIGFITDACKRNGHPEWADCLDDLWDGVVEASKHL